MFIIAEIGQAHDGSLGMAHSFIDALAETGVDAVKFQTHIAEAESSEFEPFRVKFSSQDKSRFDYWKRMEFTLEEWRALKQHCDDLGLAFISSPFSNAAVDLLEEIGVDKYKIGSGEVTNTLMLNKIAKTGKPVILSSGMSSYQELDVSVNLLVEKNIDVSILQCTTAYPTLPEQWGLNVISELKERYKLPIGFSDHSGEIYSSLAATALGAKILEFHAVFDYRMFGPDTKASLTFDKIKSLVKGVKALERSMNSTVDKTNNSEFTDLKSIFEKSLAVNCNLKAGDVLKEEYLEAKKPKDMGINANEFTRIIGKKLRIDKAKWDFLSDEDLI